MVQLLFFLVLNLLSLLLYLFQLIRERKEALIVIDVAVTHSRRRIPPLVRRRWHLQVVILELQLELLSREVDS